MTATQNIDIDVDQVKQILTSEKSRRFDDARRLRAVTKSLRPPRRSRGDVRDQVQHELDRVFRRYMPDAARYFADMQEDFRRGLRDRSRALDVLGTVLPAPPTITMLDKPFLIWGLRHDSAADPTEPAQGFPLYDFLYDHGVSWVEFLLEFKSGYRTYFVDDEVSFYFSWRNGATDAVVNVDALLMVSGFSQAFAESGWIWSPLPLGSDIGNGRIRDTARMKVWQWWEQPPTQPLEQFAQSHYLGEVSTTGNWGIFGNGTDTVHVSGNAHLHYDALWVPANGVVVFEVGLLMHYDGFRGGGCNTFQSFPPGLSRLTCPYVQLEIQTGEPVIHP